MAHRRQRPRDQEPVSPRDTCHCFPKRLGAALEDRSRLPLSTTLAFPRCVGACWHMWVSTRAPAAGSPGRLILALICFHISNSKAVPGEAHQ